MVANESGESEKDGIEVRGTSCSLDVAGGIGLGLGFGLEVRLAAVWFNRCAMT